ncbi:MAG: TetR/AcrR family transcriptional regulator [Bacteroidaceae bacterium]|nr:TetR/AcrR family transcriptional regulator [Bacteroidaceae bacterium]
MENQKTRQQIVAAAKTVFIRKGFDDTTMMDIADEADLSRRTLYAYFESKYDIYKAVIDSVMEQVLVKLGGIAALNLPPEQKILEFTFGRFRVLKEMVDSNGTLRSGFFRNIWGLEHYRKDFDQKEKLLLQQIIQEGKECGRFNVNNVRRTAEFFQNCMRGFEVPYIRGRIWKGNTREEVLYESKRLIHGALGITEEKRQ